MLSLEAMSDPAAYGKLKFGPFELSIGERLLRRHGVVVPLGSRALDILVYLAGRAGEVIAKQELIDHVWSDVTVEEGSLRVHLAAIRRALGDGQFGNRYIANIKGRGYSFVGPVIPLAGSLENGNDRSGQEGRLLARPLMIIARESVMSEVSDKLRDERFINIRDNCEHVIKAVALLAEQLYQQTEQVDEAETRVWFLFECGRSA
jgi:DNA-binding winged helix-turn-helix (wHTH) protein